MFFSKGAFDRFNLTKEEFALVKEKEDKDDKDKDKDKGKEGEQAKEAEQARTSKADADKKEPVKDVVIDWEGLDERKARLTTHTSPANDWVLSKDGEKLYYLTNVRQGRGHLGDRAPHERDEAVREAWRQVGLDGDVSRWKVHLPARRRQGQKGRHRGREERSR